MLRASIGGTAVLFLGGYFSHIKADLIERPAGSVVSYDLALSPSLEKYKTRSCNPTPPTYRAVKNKERMREKEQSEDLFFVWLPEEEHRVAMQLKLQGVVARSNLKKKSTQYRGSIEMGIDVRRTIRARFHGERGFYVKSVMPHREHIETDREPILWILSEAFDQRWSASSSALRSPRFGKFSPTGATRFLIGCMEFAESDAFGNFVHRLSLMEDPSQRAVYGDVCGLLCFGVGCYSEEDAKNVYGDKWEVRIPNHGDFDHPSGCVHRDLAPLARGGAPWAEIALRTAIKYAERAVVIAASPGIPIASQMHDSIASASGKQLVYFATSSFSRSELKKLRTSYNYQSHGESDAEAKRNFDNIMRSTWN